MTTHLSTDPAVREPGQRSTTSNGRTGHAAGTTPMTAASLEELRNELARVRRRARLQIAQELGEARSFGEGSNNDEYHAVREEQMVLEAHLAALEQRIERATVVGPDEAPRERLLSGRQSRSKTWPPERPGATGSPAHQSLGPDVISAASPVGQALIGALPGVTVTVDLPNGRSRSVRLVDVAQ